MSSSRWLSAFRRCSRSRRRAMLSTRAMKSSSDSFLNMHSIAPASRQSLIRPSSYEPVSTASVRSRVAGSSRSARHSAAPFMPGMK